MQYWGVRFGSIYERRYRRHREYEVTALTDRIRADTMSHAEAMARFVAQRSSVVNVNTLAATELIKRHVKAIRQDLEGITPAIAKGDFEELDLQIQAQIP